MKVKVIVIIFNYFIKLQLPITEAKAEQNDNVFQWKAVRCSKMAVHSYNMHAILLLLLLLLVFNSLNDYSFFTDAAYEFYWHLMPERDQTITRPCRKQFDVAECVFLFHSPLHALKIIRSCC